MLMQKYEEKSWRLSDVDDQHRAVLEQKKNVERDYAILRQHYEAVTFHQKWKAGHDAHLPRESGLQTHELGASQHGRCISLKEHRLVADARATLQQQYEQQSRELVALRRRHQQAEKDCAVQNWQRGEQSRGENLNAVHRECQIALEQKEKLRRDHAVLRQEYEAQRNQNNTLREDNRSLKAALEQRTSELHGVERFLATADTCSGAEVVSTLRTLNAGMQQSITSMAEWMVNNLAFEVPRTDQLEIMEQTRTSELLGFKFLRLLGAKMCADNPTLLEIALQAYLTYELYRVASQRTIRQEDQLHVTFIDGIYRRMQEAEGQAISGNWRALTYLYTAPAFTSDSEHMRTINTTIISGLSDILLAAGCTASRSDVMFMLASKFAKKTQDFVSLAEHINKIIGAGVVSVDFEVLVVVPGTPFDEKVMEDWDNDGVGETVLCVMELGLVKRVRGEPSMMLVKPKVALVSVLDIIN